MMSSTQRFIDYANRVVYYNIILKGTEHHSDDKKLRGTFIGNMSEGLINKVDLSVNEHTRICEAPNLNIQWIKEIETIDRRWKIELKNTASMMNEILKRLEREKPLHNTRDQSDRKNYRYHPYRRTYDDGHHDDRQEQPDCDRNHGNSYNSRHPNSGRMDRSNEYREFSNPSRDHTYQNSKRCPPLTQHERNLLNQRNSISTIKAITASVPEVSCIVKQSAQVPNSSAPGSGKFEHRTNLRYMEGEGVRHQISGTIVRS